MLTTRPIKVSTRTYNLLKKGLEAHPEARWYQYTNEAIDSAAFGDIQWLLVGPGCTNLTPPTNLSGAVASGWAFQFTGPVDISEVTTEESLDFVPVWVLRVTDAINTPDGWQANGCWQRSACVAARHDRKSALKMLKSALGYSGDRWDIYMDVGDAVVYKVRGAAIMAFLDATEVADYIYDKERAD